MRLSSSREPAIMASGPVIAVSIAANRTLADEIDRLFLGGTCACRFIPLWAEADDRQTPNPQAALARALVFFVDAKEGIDSRVRRDVALARLYGSLPGLLVIANVQDVKRAEDLERAFRAVWADDEAAGITVVRLPAGDEKGVGSCKSICPLIQSKKRRKAHFSLLVETAEEASSDALLTGRLLCGAAAEGQMVRLLPQDRGARVLEVQGTRRTKQGETIVTLRIDGAEGARKGDILCETQAPVDVSHHFAVDLFWSESAHMLPGRYFDFVSAGGRARASISKLKYWLELDSGRKLAAKELEAGDVGRCNLELDKPVVFAPFDDAPPLGLFTLHDPRTGEQAAFGLIRFALWRATNVKWQELALDRQARARAKGQRPFALWFTGLSGSGKSTLASLLEKKLHAMGKHAFVLDGDNVRHGLCRDLGFTEADRVENIRRVAETARLMTEAGLIVLVALISPFRSERRMARGIFPKDEFLEVFVDTPFEVCRQRDPKGLYKKAEAGLIRNFTGIDSPYEPPVNAEIVVQGEAAPAEETAERIIAILTERGML